MFHTSDGRKVIENLEEFDDAREVVAGLAAEYQACERPDYVGLCHLLCCLLLCLALCLHLQHAVFVVKGFAGLLQALRVP